jgi:hypothetical protein
MIEFFEGLEIINKYSEIFIVVKKHKPFSGIVNIQEPLMYVYDYSEERERYVNYCEYRKNKPNFNVISKGYFVKQCLCEEDKPRFDIKNKKTNEIIKKCYLYNGSWNTLN